MITKTIKFNSITDVKDFCAKANHCVFNMDLVSGRYCVDGKSIMGILSLSLDKTISLQINVDTDAECEKFVNEISYLLIK